MNKTFEKDDKVIIIREYGEAENPHCFNDMLEFLYAMKDELQTKVDVIRNYFRYGKLGGWNPSSLEYIRVPGDIVGSVYQMSASTKNLNLVNQMIEHVLASDKKMFAVVFDKNFSVGRKWNNTLMNPRIIDIEKRSTDTLSEINDGNHKLIFNILDNNTMMLQGARNYDHCRIQDIKEEK